MRVQETKSLAAEPIQTVRTAPGSIALTAYYLLVSMRPVQWIKNTFVLAPLVFGHKLGDPEAFLAVGLAAFAFCLFASAVYVLNDVLDAEADRAHSTKALRPIAAGLLNPATALGAAAALLVGGVLLTAAVGGRFGPFAAGYCVLMLAYCLYLKKIFLIDCLAIASGFVLRVTSGAVVANVEVSHWLIVCTFLLALFLAFAKRRHELITLRGQAHSHRAVLKDYQDPAFLDQINGMLLGATIVSYILYTIAPETVAKFGTSHLIYGSIFVIYGLLRYLHIIHVHTKGNVGDPTRVLVNDKALIATVFAWIAYNAFTIYIV
jgi:4-hydroxybenzoate polyprenyltransferase